MIYFLIALFGVLPRDLVAISLKDINAIYPATDDSKVLKVNKLTGGIPARYSARSSMLFLHLTSVSWVVMIASMFEINLTILKK